MNSLALLKLSFAYTLNYDAMFPGFMGNTFRGAIGRSLLNLFCDKHRPECQSCPKFSQCVYAQIFKSDNKSDTVSKAPAPFVLEVDYSNKRSFKKGGELKVSLVLIGSAIRYTLFFIEAMKNISEMPFDGYENVLALTSVTDAFNNTVIYSGAEFVCQPEPIEWSDGNRAKMKTDNITIELLSPTQLLKNKQLVNNVEFGFFVDSLFSRIADLCEFYGERELVLPYNLTRRKPYVISESRLRTIVINQQKTTFTAAIGSVTFEGDISAYMPYISLGEILHIGKLSTRAFGQYKVIMNDMEDF